MVLFIVKAKRTSNLEYNLTSSMQRWWNKEKTKHWFNNCHS
jgi:hypothetical protein